MNVGPDHHEPLDAEERALAERLARIGPFDGPSPALDAKILKAAHAAAGRRAPSKQRRWLAFMGVPPALVTGVGVAAAAVLALGLVWQLRPTTVLLPAMEEDGDEVFVMAEPSPEPRAAVVNPPPIPVETPARAAAPAPRNQAPAQAEAAAKATESTAQMADMASMAAADAAAGAAAPEPVAPAPPSDDEVRERGSAAPATAEAVQEPGFVPTPPAAPAAPPTAAKRRATYTNSARATSTRREAEDFRGAPVTSAQPVVAQQDAATDAGQELDKVVVTGSRIKRTDLAVRDDTRLEPAEWLERIRARRDAGELDDARESLRLFRSEYPRVRIPDDLRALLAIDPDR
ncbi:MAG TPA: hypothetical protein VGD21_15495 [Lysobacter sp.]